VNSHNVVRYYNEIADKQLEDRDLGREVKRGVEN
jgi:hypothetical protein